MTYTVTIPNFHPTPLNKLLNAHYMKAWRLKAADRAVIMAYCKGVPRARGRRRVTLTLVLAKGQRKVDVDSPFKSLLDGLVHAKALVDDHPAWCELAPLQYLRDARRGPATVVELQDL